MPGTVLNASSVRKMRSKRDNSHTISSTQQVQASGTNPWIFWGVLGVVLIVDIITKAIAEYSLLPMYTPHPILGEWLRFTLVYNPGAAFGINVGIYSRIFFTVLTLVALVVLWRLYKATPEGAVPRTLALGLVSAGALGNLFDRLRSEKGVVDFIDIGVASYRWPTFNVADIAVSTGAILLAYVLYQEDKAAAQAAKEGQAHPNAIAATTDE